MGYYSHKIFSVQHLCDNRFDYHGRGKPEQLKAFLESFYPFIQDVSVKDKRLDPKKNYYDSSKIVSLPYYKYLESRLNSVDRTPRVTAKGKRRAIKKVRDAISLYYDIHDYGLKSPLDMIRYKNGKLALIRGGRRLVILDILGYETVPVRIYKSRDVFLKYSHSPSWSIGHSDKSIYNIAQKQFAELQEKPLINIGFIIIFHIMIGILDIYDNKKDAKS